MATVSPKLLQYILKKFTPKIITGLNEGVKIYGISENILFLYNMNLRHEISLILLIELVNHASEM